MINTEIAPQPKLFALVVSSLLVAACSVPPSHQHPTPEEWLEVYTTHKIREAIDNSPRKVVIQTRVENRTISVSLRSSTGQANISESGRLAHIEDVKAVVKQVLDNNGLSSSYRASVDYIPDFAAVYTPFRPESTLWRPVTSASAGAVISIGGPVFDQFRARIRWSSTPAAVAA